MQASLDHLRQQGEDVKEEDESRLSPLGHKHVHVLGHYSFALAEHVLNGQLSPLKQVSEVEDLSWRAFSYRWTSNPVTYKLIKPTEG